MSAYRNLSHLRRHWTMTASILSIPAIIIGFVIVKETVILVTCQTSGCSVIRAPTHGQISQVEPPNNVHVHVRLPDAMLQREVILDREQNDSKIKREGEFMELIGKVLQNRSPSKDDGKVGNKSMIRKQLSPFKEVTKYRKWNSSRDSEAWHNNVSDATWFAYYKQSNTIMSPHNFRFVITAENVCARAQVDVVVTIHSSHRNRERRDAIRSTWASIARTGLWVNYTLPGQSRVVFLFGLSGNATENDLLLRESAEYGDIAQEDFIDVYKNLTLKSLMGLRWTSVYCPGALFLLKTDDDVFVHIPRLLSFVMLVRPDPRSHNSIYGRQNYPIHVLRYGKWDVDKDVYPFKRFPKYASGGGYLLSVILAERLLNASKYFPQFPLEDIGVTGVLRMALGIQLQFLPALIEKRYRYHSALCDMTRITDYVLVHAIGPLLMRSMFKMLATNGNECPKVVQVFQPLRKFLRRDVPLRFPIDSSDYVQSDA